MAAVKRTAAISEGQRAEHDTADNRVKAGYLPELELPPADAGRQVVDIDLTVFVVERINGIMVRQSAHSLKFPCFIRSTVFHL